MTRQASRSNLLLVLWLLGLGLLLGGVVELAIRALEQEEAITAEQKRLDAASRIRLLLESEINTAAFLATGVESYIVARGGDIDTNEVQRILQAVFQRGRHFRNIGIAPDNRIAWVFPFEGNQAAIGFRYEDSPQQWPAVQRVMQDGQGLLAGPVNLVQGGEGLIYRAPIFIEGHYWGLLTTVIDSESLFAVLTEFTQAEGWQIAIRGRDASGAAGDVFLGSVEDFEFDLTPQTIQVPGGTWHMVVSGGSPAHAHTHALYRLSGWLVAFALAAVIALGSRLLWQRNTLSQLQRQVEERTWALRDSNDMLASVMAAAEDFSIIATDVEGVITLFNKGAERMLGYESRELVGKTTPAILHVEEEVSSYGARLTSRYGEDISGFRAFVYEADLGKRALREWTYVRKDGSRLPVMLAVTVIRNASGQVRGYLGIAEDITERKRLEKVKNEFVSTVSHELRTPLTAIAGAVGMLRSGALGQVAEAGQKMLEIAHNNSQRLSHLIDDLLDIEKIAAGKLHFDWQRCRLRSLLEQSLDSMEAYGSEKGVKLMLAEPCPDALVRVDPQRLQQVMANLLSNAIKFSPEQHPVTVTVTSRELRVRVAVTDEGEGIPESFKASIFQKFAQADASDQRKKGGTGLGLAITRELVEYMGGEVGFDSVPGAGATFWFELPVSMQAMDSVADGTEASGPQVLVVEDEPDIAEVLSQTLVAAGYAPRTVGSLAEARSAVTDRAYGAILLDLQLPDGHGLDLLHPWPESAVGPQPPVLVVSAFLQDHPQELSGDMATLELVPKPVDMKRLLNLLQRHAPLTAVGGRILHIEDNEDLHRVIQTMIGDRFQVDYASTTEQAKNALLESAYSLVILDIHLPDGDGADLIPLIRRHNPAAAILILSGEDASASLRAQVDAAMLKSRLTKDALLERLASLTATTTGEEVDGNE
ncbi:MAG: response regulator [Marinobacter sp.]|nr:response regulator [Marinobacter sp.]